MMGSSEVRPEQMSTGNDVSEDVSKEAVDNGDHDAAGDAADVDERFQITNSLVRHVVADDIDMQNTAAGVVQAEAASLQQGLTGIAAGHEVSVTEGATWLVLGGSVDTNYSVSQWIVGGQIEAEQVASVVVVGGRVNGNVNTLLDTRGAAICGLVIGLCYILFRLIRR
ncbi:MAG: hypothetical protein OXK81_11135 [Chloroflexota bacterium]|nr:hypothetical protein [Chloroflexota bacterium]MDE2930794.1 hypothetical protein [Chloroflexota bacterium]